MATTKIRWQGMVITSHDVAKRATEPEATRSKPSH